jgi:membrane protein
MLIVPVLLVASSSFTVFVTSGITSITERVAALSMLAPLIMFGLKFLPYCVMWVLFTFIYYFIPNTRVNPGSAVLAGVIAGAIFQVTQWGYVTFQIGVAKYNAIYGSFVALPLFLVWMQISWLIVLFGAEISFAHQNVDTYEFEQESSSVSHSFKMLLSLLITHLLVKNFHRGEKSLNGAQISHFLDIPIRLVREILFELTEAGILVELKGEDDKRIFYQPGRDIDAFTIKYVMDALEEHGCIDIPVNESDELVKLRKNLGELGSLLAAAPGNVHLKDI